MPYKEIEQFATGHGVGIAVLLIVVVPAMAMALIALWRANDALHGRIETLLKERSDAVERILREKART